MISLTTGDMRKSLKNLLPALKAHFWVIVVLLVSLFFSLLPLMISAAVQATNSNRELIAVFKDLILNDAIFIYCASYITPLVILTFKMTFKKNAARYFLYPFAFIGSIYVIILGPLMYSGVVARNLYSLGQNASSIELPTIADYSILFVTLFIWYYCIFKENHVPKDTIINYEKYRSSSFEKFDGVAKK